MFAGVRGSMRSLLLFSCMFRKIKRGWENGVRATPFFHSSTTMLFLELYFNHKPVPLHELYEKAMRKYRCRSPACVLSHPAFS